MNVMQVVAYIRLYAAWSANVDIILVNLHKAITLEPLVNLIVNAGKDQFEFATDLISDENLRKSGIEDPNFFKSLGIFVFALFVLLFLSLLYLLLRVMKRCVKKYKLVSDLKDLLETKLFYNSFIRYLLQSNLKILHNSVTFLVFTGGFASFGTGALTIGQGLVCLGLLIWPIYMTVYLIKNQEKLHEKSVSKKFGTMYQGI